MGGFYWGVLRFFSRVSFFFCFFFSYISISASSRQSLRFASSRYFFLLVCVLFRVLLVSCDWIGFCFSLFYCGDLLRISIDILLPPERFRSPVDLPYPLQSILPPANLLLSVDDIQCIYASISFKNTRGRQFRCRISSS